MCLQSVKLGWAEARLYQLAKDHGTAVSDDLAARSGRLLRDIRGIRNRFHHHGMRPSEVAVEEQQEELKGIFARLKRLAGEDPSIITGR